MTDSVRIHAIVSGAVQGVGFRFSARARAAELGLSGWVRNLADGTVEAEAEGGPEAMELFVKFLNTGPDHADVRAVDVESISTTGVTGFELRH